MTTTETRELFPLRLFGNRPPLGMTAAQKEGIVSENETVSQDEPTLGEQKDFRPLPTKVGDADAPRVEAKKQVEPDPKAADSSAIDSASHSGAETSDSGKPSTPTSSEPNLPSFPSEPPANPVDAAREGQPPTLTTPQPPQPVRLPLGESSPPAETTGETPAE